MRSALPRSPFMSIAAAGTLAVLAARPVPAAMITLQCTADTVIRQDQPNDNFGAFNRIWVGHNGKTTTPLRRGLLEFDLSGIPAGATIDSAVLQLTAVDSHNVGSNFRLFRTRVDWGEGVKTGKGGAVATAGEASWTNRLTGTAAWGALGGMAGTDYLSTASASTAVPTTGTYQWNGLTADVQYWLANPSLNFGWFLISDKETTNQSVTRFATREDSTSGNRPQLIVNYTLVSPSVFGVASGPTPAALRVMRNSTASSIVGVKNTGGLAGDLTITSPSAVTVTPNGQAGVAAGATVNLAVSWASVTTTGARSGSFKVHNATNAADTDDTVSLTGAVVDNRVVTADSVDLGVQHLGANLGNIARSTTFHANGADTAFTRVTVNGQLFNADINPSLSVSGVVNSVVASGTLASYPVTPENIGDTGYAPVTVGYTAAVFSGNAKWSSTSSASWSAPGNWTDTATSSPSSAAPGTFVAPFADVDSATFDGTGSAATVNLDTAPSLKSLSFSGSTSYTIGGASRLTLKSNTGAATVTAAGTHQIGAAVSLASNTTVTVIGGSDKLTIQGAIDGAGMSLTKAGNGRLVLNNASNLYSAGTLVYGGVLEVAKAGALPAGRSLTVGAGGTVVLSSGLAGASSSAVPEPGTTTLLGAGVLAAMAFAWRLRRRTR